MALEIKLSQKLNQQLLMTPQLQQAIKLLQLGRLEYKEAIEKELLENPVLEEKDSNESEGESSSGDGNEDRSSTGDNESDESGNGDKSQDGDSIDWEEQLKNYGEYNGNGVLHGPSEQLERPSLEATLSSRENLASYLISQLQLLELGDTEKKILFQIIGNLDKDGYLCVEDEEIAEACQCGIEEVQQVIALVQTLDPPGVAARNLSECLFIQLDSMGLSDGLEGRLVRNHLDKLEKRKYDLIAKAESVEVHQVYQAVNAIRNLEPRPGRMFADDTARYITPDVYIYKDSGEYVVTLNDEGLPRLRVSPYYLRLLERADEEGVDRGYLNERLKAASWLIKSIHQRQQTIYKVSCSIAKFQREFFDNGIEYLKPLVLKDIAEDINMHESTVSRVTTNKYAHTPQGVFELKYFFSTGLKTSEGEVSSSSIKERIRNIIASENPSNPVSDQQIVEMLQADNVCIARRTVAKYREGLKILSSSQRKKHF